MVFDTRTSDMMKASLAQYFDIPCEKLVEFILKAADFAQKKSRWAFDTTVFEDTLDAFLENFEVKEEIEAVMCFHFSRRLNNTGKDENTYNLRDLLLADNPMSYFLRENGYKFFEEDGHLAFRYDGKEYYPENSSNPDALLLANRLGRNPGEADYCFNGLFFGDSLMRNPYAFRLSYGPEFLISLSAFTHNDSLLKKYKNNSTFYCYRFCIPVEMIVIDGHETFEKENLIWFLIHQMAYRIMLYEDGTTPISDDGNPIIRIADDAILPIEYLQERYEITLDMLRE